MSGKGNSGSTSGPSGSSGSAYTPYEVTGSGTNSQVNPATILTLFAQNITDIFVGQQLRIPVRNPAVMLTIIATLVNIQTPSQVDMKLMKAGQMALTTMQTATTPPTTMTVKAVLPTLLLTAALPRSDGGTSFTRWSLRLKSIIGKDGEHTLVLRAFLLSLWRWFRWTYR